MEDYPSLAEGNGLENRQVGKTTQEFESLILLFIIAGWSSLVARRAHNPKVVGSNPAPATKKDFREYLRSFSFCKNLRYKKEIVHQISV